MSKRMRGGRDRRASLSIAVGDAHATDPFKGRLFCGNAPVCRYVLRDDGYRWHQIIPSFKPTSLSHG
ncbi:MAG: hypothetical protein ACUVQ5_00415 [Candidatus Methanomethylicaceae archaeon]